MSPELRAKLDAKLAEIQHEFDTAPELKFGNGGRRDATNRLNKIYKDFEKFLKTLS